MMGAASRFRSDLNVNFHGFRFSKMAVEVVSDFSKAARDGKPGGCVPVQSYVFL
jgi:hypothetical protein